MGYEALRDAGVVVRKGKPAIDQLAERLGAAPETDVDRVAADVRRQCNPWDELERRGSSGVRG